mgnify:CR=1 FL=1
MRNTPLRAYAKKSPVNNITIAPSPERKKNKYSTSKYSPENTKDTFGAKLVKKLTPENTPAGILSAVGGGGILRKAAKTFIGGRS